MWFKFFRGVSPHSDALVKWSGVWGEPLNEITAQAFECAANHLISHQNEYTLGDYEILAGGLTFRTLYRTFSNRTDDFTSESLREEIITIIELLIRGIPLIRDVNCSPHIDLESELAEITATYYNEQINH